MGSRLRLASVNVNGIRAAYRKGMGEWLADRDVDVLTLQEVRASTDDLEGLLGPEWNVLHHPATAKGRAGVAIASRGAARIHRVELGPDDFDSAGRWIEADYDVDGTIVTVVSTYVHSGEVGTEKQDEKWKFLDAMSERLPQLAAHSELAVVTGDLNVGHRELDIKNWKGNVKRAGFLPRERAYFDRFLGEAGQPVETVDGTGGTGLGWVDVGRRLSGEVGTEKQDEKWKFLDAMSERLPQLAAHSELAVVTGDLNVGHRELDIKNWKGNVKRAGFLPRERAYFDRFFGPEGEPVETADGEGGTGLGWVDVGRRLAGEVEGPYSWWSWRGQAFDNDTGWRIDYHVATPALAERASGLVVDRAASYDKRWSDHAPVVVDYDI